MKMGDLLREWNDLPGASRLLVTGVEQCALLGQADVLTDAYVALAKLHLAQGALNEVWETLRKADDLARRSSIDPFIVCWQRTAACARCWQGATWTPLCAGQETVASQLTVS